MRRVPGLASSTPVIIDILLPSHFKEDVRYIRKGRVETASTLISEAEVSTIGPSPSDVPNHPVIVTIQLFNPLEEDFKIRLSPCFHPFWSHVAFTFATLANYAENMV